jgi:hypothetical protein
MNGFLVDIRKSGFCLAARRVRIPAKLNADSEDAERGFRASRTRLGA